MPRGTDTLPRVPVALNVLIFIAGLATVVLTIGAAIRSVILPRAVHSRLTEKVFFLVRLLVRIRIGPRAPYERHDRIMAFYGPLTLLTLLAAWLVLVMIGYAGMYWAIGVGSVRESFVLSGSSLLTLGFQRDPSVVATALSFSEAAVGLVLLALLITYLPTIYGAFQRREQEVALLETRADSPPSGVVMLERYVAIEGLERLNAVWQRYERWFADLEESHTSFPALAFFRSTQPEQSWVTASGAILDAASLLVSSVQGGERPEPQLMIRAGYLALRRIAVSFHIKVPMDPQPGDPISVTRAEFDAACDRLVAAGLELKPDREQAWRDFAGWRVNYDRSLICLARLTVAPPAPWSSDEARLPAATYGKLKGLFARG